MMGVFFSLFRAFLNFIHQTKAATNVTALFKANFVVCLYFQNILFQKKYFRKTIRVSNSLDPDQARHCIGPDLAPNRLQRLSADDNLPLAGKKLIEKACQK